ncbi:MAG TPA: DsrE family protein [Gammaproteobacteria bacterium]|nr:DsrE family protein [Gammaproteobacteria bacterium]
MGRFLLIESDDAFQSKAVDGFLKLATDLASLGHRVTLFLVQNAVLMTRRGAPSEALHAAALAGVEVLADDFSLRERGIPAARMSEHVTVTGIDTVVDRLAAGDRAFWH